MLKHLLWVFLKNSLPKKWFNFLRTLKMKAIKWLQIHFPLASNSLVVQAKKALYENRSVNLQQPPSSNRWEAYLSHIRQNIEELITVRDTIRFAQYQIGFDHRDHTGHEEMKYLAYEDLLKEEFPHFARYFSQFRESSLSIENTLKVVHGRPVSNVFYYHLRYILQCLTWIKKPNSICEIGGGYAGQVRMWMENPIFTPETYVVIDFPECLFFADVFLKSNNIKVMYISEYMAQSEKEKKVVILCPIASVHLLSVFSFDLAINTGSLQEMTEDWVDYWMKWLDNASVRYFYSLNYFAQPLHNLSESANICSPRLSNRWSLRLRRVNPHFIKQQTVRNFGEIIAEKTEPLPDLESLKILYEKTREHYLDLQNFMDCWDLVRRSDDLDMMVDLILRIKQEMPFYPKETLYILKRIQMLAGNASNCTFEKKRLDELTDHLENILKNAIKDVPVYNYN